jgi:hypothetical protein
MDWEDVASGDVPCYSLRTQYVANHGRIPRVHWGHKEHRHHCPAPAFPWCCWEDRCFRDNSLARIRRREREEDENQDLMDGLGRVAMGRDVFVTIGEHEHSIDHRIPLDGCAIGTRDVGRLYPLWSLNKIILNLIKGLNNRVSQPCTSTGSPSARLLNPPSLMMAEWWTKTMNDTQDKPYRSFEILLSARPFGLTGFPSSGIMKPNPF